MAIDTYSLITLAAAKDFMSLKVTDDDTLIEDIINSISTLFETYMGINILSREYTEYYDGKGHNILFTDQHPITTVSGVLDDSEWTWGDDTLISGTSYRIANSNSIVFKDTTLLDYQQNIKIIYTAGYITTPADIELSCIEEVVRTYKNKHQVDVASKSLADGSVSYVVKDFLPKTLTVLNKYRRLSII